MSTLPDIDMHLCIKGLLKTSTNSNFSEEYPISNTPTNFKSSRKYRLRPALGSGFDLNEFCKHKLLHFFFVDVSHVLLPFLEHDEDKVRQRKKKMANYCCRVTDEHAAACLLFSCWRKDTTKHYLWGNYMRAKSQVI